MPFFTLRINKIKIINNREPVGSGEVKLLSFITTEDQPLPMLDDYFEETDVNVQRQLLAAAAKEVVSSKALMRIDNIPDGHTMTFGDTGYSLWTVPDAVPKSFNWQMVLIEVDQDVREIGAWINALLADPEFDVFLDNVIKLAAFGANPTVTLSIAIGKYVIGKIADELLQNKDDQLGVVYQSFYRGLDYPGLDRQAHEIPDTTGNLRIDYRLYGEET